MGTVKLSRFGIGMMMNISRIKLFGLLGVGLVMLSIFISVNTLPKGFELANDRNDDVHLLKDGKIVVGSTIVDLKVIDNMIVGLKIPIDYLVCDHASYSKIRLRNERKFFVLSAITNLKPIYFDTQGDLEAYLFETNGKKNIELDTDRAEQIWQKYSDVYKFDDGTEVCKYFPVGTKEYEKMHF